MWYIMEEFKFYVLLLLLSLQMKTASQLTYLDK